MTQVHDHGTTNPQHRTGMADYEQARTMKTSVQLKAGLSAPIEALYPQLTHK
ncbi:hypothetical protein [Arthrobacter sp. Soil736]|uniref:hypothetical protein n=1 Tax=Arthrobacter sp. Soil736 TaxID=1736395 RepID=UPI000AC1EA99|nr:hypothetical protein [Arthrobacter sp. Soil736]